MLFFIIIAVVIFFVIICVVGNDMSKKTEIKKSYAPIIKEVLNLLEMLQKFNQELDKRYREILHNFVQIIPVNSNGELYGHNKQNNAERADRIWIMTLVEIDDEFVLDIFNFVASETGISQRYNICGSQSSRCYRYGATSFCNFEGFYKDFMPFLKDAVVEKFPDLKIEFDGSRIMIYM